jgi:hypothetical protein
LTLTAMPGGSARGTFPFSPATPQAAAVLIGDLTSSS